MTHKVAMSAAVLAIVAATFVAVGPVQAGTCQQAKAMGLAKNMATATAYAQADLKQTAKSLKGKVTQASTNCVPFPSGYRCKINAVVCPK
jgi:hypothetical protein